MSKMTIAQMKARAAEFGDANLFEKIANNSYRAAYADGSVRYFHQQTPLLTFQGIKLHIRTDGWETKTKADRIDRWLPQITGLRAILRTGPEGRAVYLAPEGHLHGANSRQHWIKADGAVLEA
ncbi:MAG: hypothetical protein GVY24_08075 [Planctomycetes bacterium]|jgi:hypothetical protein|nr:hypothetical protein [Planctomycetota bacterium]